MRKFFRLSLIFLSVLMTTQVCLALDASETKILVLPDSLQFSSTNYLVYPDSSVIFASDIINNLKISGKVQTVSMTQVRDTFRKDLKLQILAKNTLKEFKYNYNVGFVDLKRLAHSFGTDKVLIITSTTDAQNYVLRRTIWDFFNIPGATVINPAYKVSTYAVLVDVDKEEVLWQKTFHKVLSAAENRIIAVNFAPATEQLEKIKAYSANHLAPQIAAIVEYEILPKPVLPEVAKPQMVNIVQPKAELSVQSKIEKVEPAIIKPKALMPMTPRIIKPTSSLILNDL